MTAVAGPVTARRPAPVLPPADAPGPAQVPRLADGVELLGEYKGSGYSQPPSLVRRADGQVIQMSALLYRVACRIDGSRGAAAIADLASADLGRSLTADQVRYLITAKLLPLGIVAAEGAPAAAPKANPLLALRARGTLLPERAANAAGALLTPLFRWPVVVAVAGQRRGRGLLAVRRPRAGRRGPAGRARPGGPAGRCSPCPWSPPCSTSAGTRPGCRYGGARPGVIGVGIYMVWPAFFTNVTDSYRLSRAGRLRTDLGGLYFNAVFMLALAGIYTATSDQLLLLVIALTHLEMLEQLMPFARFDGYYILSDLVGVPDLFARVMPIVKSALPGGRRDPRVTGLRRRARIVVTAWVLCVIPLLLFSLGYLVLHLPAVDRALWGSASQQAHLMTAAAAGHRYAIAAVDAIGIALVALPLAGSLYIVTGLARRLTALGRRWSAWPSRSPPPGRRGRPGGPGGAGRVLDPARPVPWLVRPPARQSRPGPRPGPRWPPSKEAPMSAAPAMTSAAPAVTAQDLELEHAELLPARETLWVTRLYPRYNPGGPMIHDYPGHPVHVAQYA